MTMPESPGFQPAAQGAASIGDVTTALQGIIRQLTAGNSDLQDVDTNVTAAINAQTDTLNTQLAALVAAVLAVFPTAMFSGSFTLGASASTVVNDGHVLSSSIILLSPTNASAGTLMGSAKSLYISAKSAGVSFTVTTASGVAGASTETFNYVIFNP